MGGYLETLNPEPSKGSHLSHLKLFYPKPSEERTTNANAKPASRSSAHNFGFGGSQLRIQRVQLRVSGVQLGVWRFRGGSA